MCSLFGFIDYGKKLTSKQKSILTGVLAEASETRGTDATGIAYNSRNRLRIYKRPAPAHKLRFRIPGDADIVMGHTRMTTQGSERKNHNNHPFPGVADSRFALAHNGIIHNDIALRKSLKLPPTKVETDSYIAVQLIEHKKTLNLSSLKNMSETVEGSFSFTLLDDRNRLFLVKGDSPICMQNIEALGIILYTSTADIMQRVLTLCGIEKLSKVEVSVSAGEILEIRSNGRIERDRFDYSLPAYLSYPTPYSRYCMGAGFHGRRDEKRDEEYISLLKEFGKLNGVSEFEIDCMLDAGLDALEVEEIIFDPRARDFMYDQYMMY